MNRRQALKSIVLSTGVIISSGSFVSVLRAAEKSTSADWLPVFFDREESFAVSQIADIILPASDTPGALDVAVPRFIDLLLKDVLSVAESDKFRRGLQVFLRQFKQENRVAFHEAREDLRRAFVVKIYAVGAADPQQVLDLVAGESAPAGREDEYYLWSFLVTQRELTIDSYFTSEKVGEKVLSYDPIPGRYDPCIPVEQVGNVWSL